MHMVDPNSLRYMTREANMVVETWVETSKRPGAVARVALSPERVLARVAVPRRDSTGDCSQRLLLQLQILSWLCLVE